jgi:hypothetical protein
MSIRPLVPLTIAVALTMPAAARAQYNYTPIARTGSGSGFAGVFPPQINQVGSVAFGATLTNGGQGIFVGTQGVVVPIVQTGTTFNSFQVAPAPIVTAINPGTNTNAFFATRTAAAGGGGGVFTSDSLTVSTIASTTPPSQFTTFGVGVDINAGNNVAFTAGNVTTQGVFIGAPGAPLTTVATTGTVFTSFNAAVAINASGQTSYSAALTAAAGGGAGVFRFTPQTGGTTSIAATGAQFAGFGGPTDINDSGQVAFLAARTIVAGGGFGIFRGNGVLLDTIATTGSVFSQFGSTPSINNFGDVVFSADLTAGGQGIFNGPNAVTNKIIRTGDLLDGSTVTSVALASGAFNDLGQVAFVAALADGRQGIYVARPVPEPASVLLIAGTALAAGGWWRRRWQVSTSPASLGQTRARG